jgi:hypothetical protein
MSPVLALLPRLKARLDADYAAFSYPGDPEFRVFVRR